MSSSPETKKTISYLPTNEAYDLWARTYDSDGNFLQAMDTIEMQTLFPRFAQMVTAAPLTNKTEEKQTKDAPKKIIDLGCGTGRNTALLLSIGDADVIAVDSSAGMLHVAQAKLHEVSRSSSSPLHNTNTSNDSTSSSRPRVTFDTFDLLSPTSTPLPDAIAGADGIISTLVLEHIPLAAFFAQVSRMLRPGGILLLTNMHPDMGKRSQAGFHDDASGSKIRPTSYPHDIANVVKEARACGLDFVKGPTGTTETTGDNADGGGGTTIGAEFRECAVSEDMIERLGPRSAKWVGCKCWFGGLLQKASGQ